MGGIYSEVLSCINVNFAGNNAASPTMVSDGQLIIGSSSGQAMRIGHLTSNDGTITVTNGHGTIDLSASAETLAMGTFGSSPNADGGTIATNTLTLQPADGTHPGGVSTGTQTLAGAKTFSTSISSPELFLTGSSTGTISILPQANAGTFNFNLPITAGTSGYFLTSGGGGSAPMTWESISAAGAITTIDGDSGSVTPSSGVVTITGGTTGLTTSGTSSTLTLTGTLALGSGGTSAALTASNGGIFYSTASAGAILAGTSTARQMLQSGSSTTPAWSTATWPATTTINQVLYSSSANTVAGVTAGNNGVFISSSAGVPSWLANSSTAGYVLTANSGAPPSWQATSSGSAITTIDGDSGSVTPTAGVVTISGGTTGLTTSGSGSTLDLTGILGIANGGTNASSFTQSNGIVTYNGTSLVNYAGPQINSSGIATNTTQPAFNVELSGNVTNATGDGTTVQVPFNSVTFDQDSNFTSGSSAHFTAPVTGTYHFDFTVALSNLLVSHTSLIVAFYNADQYIRINPYVLVDSGGYMVLSGSALLQLSATGQTYMQVTVSGGTKTVTLNGGSAVSMEWSGYLVC